MVGPVVVGVDGSDTAELALRRAAMVAKALEAELHVVAVVTDTVVEPDEGGFVMAIDMGDQLVESAAELVRTATPEITVHKAALPGLKAGEALVRYAETNKAQMIVIGNRGMQGMRRLLGSVPNDVAHSAHCDVLVVRTT